MTTALEPVSITGVAESAAATGVLHAAGPASAVRDFEALFVETLLQHAGLAAALDGGEGPEGGMVGELLVRELAHGLADQLKMGFGRYLGIEPTQDLREDVR